jgi:DNA-3-methyladenine glycosylase
MEPDGRNLVELLSDSALTVGPRLLGSLLVYDDGKQRLVGKIVETEAYDQTDAASHSYRGRTPRTDIMFGPAGHLYVYFTYGMHYCCNVVTGPEGHGSAVLIRAVEPLQGEDWMLQNRRGRGGNELTNGPAKLCQAFGISRAHNGHDLRMPPLTLEIQEPINQTDIVISTRIGISQAKDMPWRWYIRGNPYVSRP